MKKLTLVLGMFFLLVSCKDISGNLTVQKQFEAVVKKECDWNPFSSCDSTKKIMVEPGSYESVIDFSSKDTIKLSLKANKVNETILINRPANFQFPTNGSFHLGSNEINQVFDIDGNVQTLVDTSEKMRDYERCSYTVDEYICYPSGDGHSQCSYQPMQRWGTRFVEYYRRTTSTTLVADLLVKNSDSARFTGHKDESEKIYTYQGFCR